MAAEQRSTPRIKLRWYQFSLRSLFLLTLAVAIGMSYVAVTIQAQRAQSEAAKAIEALGGRIELERSWLGRLLRDESLVNVTSVDLTERKVTDAVLSPLQRLPQLRKVTLGQTKISDAGLKHLERLSQLRELSLNETEITDAGLAHVAELYRLESLFLRSTKVGDAGMIHLRRLTRLRELTLHYTMVGDAGLLHLSELRNLEQLGLARTAVTDAGIASLQHLPRLKILDLDHTRISDAGLECLLQLKQLESLSIDGNSQITDAGLAHLKKLRKLRYISMVNIGITRRGLVDFERALPNCEIRLFAPVGWWTMPPWYRDVFNGQQFGREAIDPNVVPAHPPRPELPDELLDLGNPYRWPEVIDPNVGPTGRLNRFGQFPDESRNSTPGGR